MRLSPQGLLGRSKRYHSNVTPKENGNALGSHQLWTEVSSGQSRLVRRKSDRRPISGRDLASPPCKTCRRVEKVWAATCEGCGGRGVGTQQKIDFDRKEGIEGVPETSGTDVPGQIRPTPRSVSYACTKGCHPPSLPGVVKLVKPTPQSPNHFAHLS